MGSKPTVQLAPYILTNNTRSSLSPKRNSDRSKASVWIYIYGNLKELSQHGVHFDLPIVSDIPYTGDGLYLMKVESPKYCATVTNVTQIDQYRIVIHIRLKTRWFKKKLAYSYGGAINYLDSRGNF